MTLYDQLRAQEGFDLSEFLDIKDYLDCVFLLAEQCERSGRFREAAALYEELYERVYKRLYERLKPLYKEIREITGYPSQPGKRR